MNTAIQGAKTPSEIMARSAAAKLAAQQTQTEGWKPGVLHEQASDLAASASLKDAQRAKTLVDTENARTGTMVNNFAIMLVTFMSISRLWFPKRNHSFKSYSAASQFVRKVLMLLWIPVYWSFSSLDRITL